VVRTWCVHHDLGYTKGRDRYKARVRIADPPPGDRPWSHLNGPHGWLAPMPPEWSYALIDHARYQHSGPSRPTARQVASRNATTSVWVNHLTGEGLHRLLEQVDVGHEVFPERQPAARTPQPASIPGDRAGPRSGNRLGGDRRGQPDYPPPFTAVFATAEADPARARTLLGPLDRDGRYRARL
jgi:hypothetical protein